MHLSTISGMDSLQGIDLALCNTLDNPASMLWQVSLLSSFKSDEDYSLFRKNIPWGVYLSQEGLLT